MAFGKVVSLRSVADLSSLFGSSFLGCGSFCSFGGFAGLRSGLGRFGRSFAGSGFSFSSWFGSAGFSDFD